MILTLMLNPSVDETIFVEELRLHDTNRVLRVEVDAGGKGINLARVAHALGSPVMALGFIGGKTGQFVCAVLSAEGVPHDFIWLDRPTRRNLCIEEANGRPPTMLNDPGPEISPPQWEALLAKQASANADFVAPTAEEWVRIATMIAGVLHILAQGGSLEESLRWGTATGAATATTSGAEIARREQVLELLPQVKIRRIDNQAGIGTGSMNPT